MKVKRNLSNFPKRLNIFKAVEKGSSSLEYVDYINNIDELEDCVIQALMDKDNDYYVEVENSRFNLLEDNLYERLDNMFHGATAFPMISYNLIEALRDNENIESAKTLYEKYYGKIN